MQTSWGRGVTVEDVALRITVARQVRTLPRPKSHIPRHAAAAQVGDASLHAAMRECYHLSPFEPCVIPRVARHGRPELDATEARDLVEGHPVVDVRREVGIELTIAHLGD